MNTKKVLVTGANGHVGYNIVVELVRRGYQVRGSVRDMNDKNKTEKLRKLNVELVQADLLDRASLDKATEGVEGVFQVAAGYKLHSKNPELEIRQPAIDGTRNLLSACKLNGIKKVIYTSSIASIGVSSNGQVRNENHWNLEAREYYAQAKTEAEQLAWEIAKNENINLVTILPGTVIGPYFDSHTPTTYLFKKIFENKMPMKMDVQLAFVDVRDLALAHVDAYEKEETNGRYIVSDDLFKMDDIFIAAQERFPHIKIPKKYVPKWMIPLLPAFDWIESKFTKNSVRTVTQGIVSEYMSGGSQLMDNSKAKNDLGFSPRPIKKSIQDTLEWISKNGL